MKKKLFALALSVFFGSQSFAQNPNAPKRTAEERATVFVKNLSKEVSLSEEQSNKIKAIQLETFNKIDVIREKGMASDDKKGMRQEVKTLNDATEASIEALLTNEQKTKFNTWQEKKKEEMKNRQSGGGSN